MKPIVTIDFNEVFANTQIYDELSAVVFGAELALRHANVPEAQIKDIRNSIVRSAFSTFSLDYKKMSAGVHPNGSAAPVRRETSVSQNPVGSGSETDGYEQTVVYENYPDPAKMDNLDTGARNGYANAQENQWGETEGGQNENSGFGKIQWTTYSSSANMGGDPSNASFNQFDANPENK